MRTFQEIKDNYRFNAPDIETLKNLLAVVSPHVDTIVSDFYNLFLTIPDAAKFLKDEANWPGCGGGGPGGPGRYPCRPGESFPTPGKRHGIGADPVGGHRIAGHGDRPPPGRRLQAPTLCGVSPGGLYPQGPGDLPGLT
ncbi:MAG: hypothetical protein KKD99_12475 [Proteobacteria bacterium]|nr:hypothetical protein [Pseudomonadota bacterium]MBU4354037.1 hypothetical protein [Pseudomonadota bacterium]MBU4449393.1 hypothetical protein [Pseudomonadota bacterium]